MNNDVLAPILIAIISLIGSLAGNLFLLRKINSEARKTDAEAQTTLRGADTRAIEVAGATYEKLIDTLQEQVKDQAARIEHLEEETNQQENEIAALTEQLGQLREVNADLLTENAGLRLRVEQCEKWEELFGKK